MKKSKKILAVGIIATMAIFTPSLFAFDGNGDGRGYRSGGGERSYNDGNRGNRGNRGKRGDRSRKSKHRFFGNIERMKQQRWHQSTKSMR